MKLAFVTLLVAIFLQCNFLLARGLQCYQCVYYDGINNNQAVREPSNPSCHVGGPPDPKRLVTCKEGSHTCALINLIGTDSYNKPFKMTLRQCRPQNPDYKGCHNMDYDELATWPSVKKENDALKLLPNRATKVSSCTCTENACNENIKRAQDASDRNSLADLTTVSRLSYVVCFVLLYIVVFFRM